MKDATREPVSVLDLAVAGALVILMVRQAVYVVIAVSQLVVAYIW